MKKITSRKVLFFSLIILLCAVAVIAATIKHWGTHGTPESETAPVPLPRQRVETKIDELLHAGIKLNNSDKLSILASCGAAVVCEATWVMSVDDDPQQSIPLIAQLPKIRAVTFYQQTIGSEIEMLADLAELNSLLFSNSTLPQTLHFLEELRHLRMLTMSQCDLTDGHFRGVKLAMPLEHLDISFNRTLSHRVMEAVGYPSSLQILHLESTKVSSLEFVGDMSPLEELYLAGSAVTDKDMKFLMSLPKLHTLNLQWTRVSDAAIGTLVQIESLRLLNISETEITADGASRLRERIRSVSFR